MKRDSSVLPFPIRVRDKAARPEETQGSVDSHERAVPGNLKSVPFAAVPLGPWP